MEFINHTPFPALAYEGVDQVGDAFHVLVMRQTLTFASGALEYADDQAPLCVADELFDAQGSVRQESDLCPYKPRCDVLVNATAYAPLGKPRRRFDVRLRLLKKTGASDEQVLIDKPLVVTGERYLQKRVWVTPLVRGFIVCSTLGLIRTNPWKLSRPSPVHALPLRYENAYGGECRINVADRAAKNVSAKQRLTEAEREVHPDSNVDPSLRAVLHSVWQENTGGKGYADPAYLAATRKTAIPAPQIERRDTPFSAALFWKALVGAASNKRLPADGALESAGLGAVSKLAPWRVAMCGTIDDKFVHSGAPLPPDFDFRYWNAAPVDQQTDFLGGGESIVLTNLCAADTPGAVADRNGNIILHLTLLLHECYVLFREHEGNLFSQALAIDTVLVEPGQHLLTLVWRAVVPKKIAAGVRVVEARLRTHSERDALSTASWFAENLTSDEMQVSPEAAGSL